MMHIKKRNIRKTIILLLCLFFFYGCTGYFTRIDINTDYNSTLNIMQHIDERIIAKGYMRDNEENGTPNTVSYNKVRKNRAIFVLVRYSYINEEKKANYVIIGNKINGNKEPLRTEIEEMTNYLLTDLEKLIGKPYFNIKRHKTIFLD